MGDFYDQVTHFIPDFACKVTHFHPNNKSYCMFFFFIISYELYSFLRNASAGETKTGINPLKSMGQSPGAMLPLWAYKSALLTPQAKA